MQPKSVDTIRGERLKQPDSWQADESSRSLKLDLFLPESSRRKIVLFSSVSTAIFVS
jgi:hypothetical protein